MSASSTLFLGFCGRYPSRRRIFSLSHLGRFLPIICPRCPAKCHRQAVCGTPRSKLAPNPPEVFLGWHRIIIFVDEKVKRVSKSGPGRAEIPSGQGDDAYATEGRDN